MTLLTTPLQDGSNVFRERHVTGRWTRLGADGARYDKTADRCDEPEHQQTESARPEIILSVHLPPSRVADTLIDPRQGGV
jgi:hypothetical protein